MGFGKGRLEAVNNHGDNNNAAIASWIEGPLISCS
jgi:hypothetical protein